MHCACMSRQCAGGSKGDLPLTPLSGREELAGSRITKVVRAVTPHTSMRSTPAIVRGSRAFRHKPTTALTATGISVVIDRPVD